MERIDKFEVVPYYCDFNEIQQIRETGQFYIKFVLQSVCYVREDADSLQIDSVKLSSPYISTEFENGQHRIDSDSLQKFDWIFEDEDLKFDLCMDLDRNVKNYQICFKLPNEQFCVLKKMTQSDWKHVSEILFSLSKISVVISDELSKEKKTIDFEGMRNYASNVITWTKECD